MSNSYIKTVGKTAAEIAKQAAKQAAREPLEILKQTAPVAGMGSEKKVSSPDIPWEKKEVSGQQTISPVEQQKMESDTRKRLQELEEEIRQMRLQRQRNEEEWQKQQEQLLNPPSEVKPQEVLQEPKGKRPRGFMGMVKKKQGTKEIGKAVSG